MSMTRLRQVARLEKRALPYIERKRRLAEERKASAREKAFVTVANLALLILYGAPKIGEPLTCAWQRCLQSEAWKACREKPLPPRRGRRAIDFDEEDDNPFDDEGARSVAQYFRVCFLPELPGADETEKLNAVFAKAPAWLLWFTHGEVPVLSLGLKLPDLSGMSRFGRPDDLRRYLPDGAFELRRLPEGVEDPTLSLFLELERKQMAVDAELTPRERMRRLKLKESGAVSGSGSCQSSPDERPDGDEVAALLRRFSQESGFAIGASD